MFTTNKKPVSGVFHTRKWHFCLTKNTLLPGGGVPTVISHTVIPAVDPTYPDCPVWGCREIGIFVEMFYVGVLWGEG